MLDSNFETNDPIYENLTGMGPYLLSYSSETDPTRTKISILSEDSIKLNNELGANKTTLISDNTDYGTNLYTHKDEKDENLENKQKAKQEIFQSKLNQIFQELFPRTISPVSHKILSAEKQCEEAQIRLKIRLKNRQVSSVKNIIEDHYKNIKQGIHKDALIWSKINTAVGGEDSELGEKLHSSQALNELLQDLG